MSGRVFPELLVPAGDPDKLATALLYGADAVYLGGELSLRAKAKGFTWDELDQGIALVHDRGKKVYYCLNILAREAHMPAVEATLERLGDYAPGQGQKRSIDGLIIADPGVLALARKHAPAIPIHLSTQANTANSASLGFWKDQGVRRVNLARELDARSLRKLAGQCPGLELEIFVHGALCMAVSGRCLLSDNLVGRSANMGLCAHPCRYKYRALTVEEQTRPGRALWEAVDNGEYTALFAADELCLAPYLPWLTRQGFAALKLEGRTKSESYLAQVTDVYATALKRLRRNDFSAGGFAGAEYLAELRNTATRSLGTGFFLPRGEKVLAQPLPETERKPILSKILDAPEPGRYLVAVRGPWDAARDAVLLLPGMERPRLKAGTYMLENLEGERISRAHPGVQAFLRCESEELRPGLFIRAG